MYLSNHPAVLTRVMAPGLTPGKRAAAVLNTTVVPHYTAGGILIGLLIVAAIYLLFRTAFKAGRG